MKAIDRLRSQLESIGATIDDSGGYSLHCDAPRGYVWCANGMVGYSIHYATNSQQWLTQALREEMPALKMGLRLANADEQKDIEWNNDDGPWIAADGAPEKIEWPSGAGVAA